MIHDLQTRLGLSTPIIQAPMAGASDTDFVVSACKTGVLGSLGAGMMSPNTLHSTISAIKQKTDKPFNVNLMILDKTLTQHFSEPIPAWLDDFYHELGIDVVLDAFPAQNFDEQFAVLLNNPVVVASFTFGILTKAQVDALHVVGSLVVGTANTVCEAQAWQSLGADAVVVQGIEAGGHQGGWRTSQKLPTLSLLKAVKAQTHIPLIAARGIGTKSQLQQMLHYGANMVAIGTLFLTTYECPISSVWRQQLLTARGSDTRLTRLFSGKLARGIVNGYMQRFYDMDCETYIPTYPTMNALTKPLRAYGNQKANADLMSLWAGMAVEHCRHQSMRQLVESLIK